MAVAIPVGEVPIPCNKVYQQQPRPKYYNQLTTNFCSPDDDLTDFP